MSEAELPSWSDVRRAIEQLALATSPAELHGAMSGWAAGGGADTPDWLARVMADDSVSTPPRGGVLEALRGTSLSQLGDRDFGFDLLLPPDDASLAERSGAVFDWCRGFLGGFGLAAGEAPPLSEEGREALADIARLAAATAQDGEGDQEEEDALAEIEEFVRVAVLLLHGDCVLAQQHRQRLN